MEIDTFVKNSTFIMVLKDRLGQNVRNDRRIISGFHQKNDFDPYFAGQSPCFPENLEFYFLCLNNLFLCGGHICEAFISLEYRIYPIFLFQNTYIPGYL